MRKSIIAKMTVLTFLIIVVIVAGVSYVSLTKASSALKDEVVTELNVMLDGVIKEIEATQQSIQDQVVLLSINDVLKRYYGL